MKARTTAKRPAAKAAPELDDALFERRLARHYDELKWLYCELYHGDIAIAALDQECDRVIAAKAADEMLTLQGVRASFVLYRKDDGIYISARSLGEINVQVLVETLGGGGNSTTAGGQCSGMTVAEAKTPLLRAIDKYFEE